MQSTPSTHSTCPMPPASPCLSHERRQFSEIIHCRIPYTSPCSSGQGRYRGDKYMVRRSIISSNIPPKWLRGRDISRGPTHAHRRTTKCQHTTVCKHTDRPARPLGARQLTQVRGRHICPTPHCGAKPRRASASVATRHHASRHPAAAAAAGVVGRELQP